MSEENNAVVSTVEPLDSERKFDEQMPTDPTFGAGDQTLRITKVSNGYTVAEDYNSVSVYTELRDVQAHIWRYFHVDGD